MRVSGGYIIVPSSLQVALPERPKDLGIDGPVISASRMAVLRPDWRALTARSEVTSDFPTPPLPLTTAITFFTFYYYHFLSSVVLFFRCSQNRSLNSYVNMLRSLDNPPVLIIINNVSVRGINNGFLV